MARTPDEKQQAQFHCRKEDLLVSADEVLMAILDCYRAAFAEGPEIVIVSTPHSDYRANQDLIDRVLALDDVFVLDTGGLFTAAEIATLSRKHKVRVVGRGDIR